LIGRRLRRRGFGRRLNGIPHVGFLSVRLLRVRLLRLRSRRAVFLEVFLRRRVFERFEVFRVLDRLFLDLAIFHLVFAPLQPRVADEGVAIVSGIK
jgi:hypothetical protein